MQSGNKRLYAALKRGYKKLLFNAALDGDVATLSNLLEKKEFPIDINEKNTMGFTPLMVAIISDQFEAAVYLFKKKADIKCQDNYQRDGIILAALFCPDFFSYLQAKGILLEDKAAIAAIEGDLDSLVEHKENSSLNVLISLAAAYGHVNVIKYLFTLSRMIKERIKRIEPHSVIAHPVYLAANQDRLEVIQYLFSIKGIALEVYLLALKLSAIKGNLSILQDVEARLCQPKKHQINCQDGKDGIIAIRHSLFLALKYAIKNRRINILDYLLSKYQYSVNVNDKMSAAGFNILINKEILSKHSVLFKSFFTFTSRKPLVQQALHIAAKLDDLIVFTYLVETHQLKIDRKNIKGETLLHVAARKSELNVARYIIMKEVDLLFISNREGVAPIKIISEACALQRISMFSSGPLKPSFTLLASNLANEANRGRAENRQLAKVLKTILRELNIDFNNVKAYTHLSKALEVTLTEVGFSLVAEKVMFAEQFKENYQKLAAPASQRNKVLN